MNIKRRLFLGPLIILLALSVVVPSLADTFQENGGMVFGCLLYTSDAADD